MEESSDHNEPSFIHTALHINYFLMAGNSLPSHYIGLDNTKISAMYFIVVALDLLDGLSYAMRTKFIEAIYFYQLHPSCYQDIADGMFGFIGGSFLRNDQYPELSKQENRKFAQGHIAMIYTAIAALITLGDDLSRVDVESIRKGNYRTNFAAQNAQ